MDRMVRDPSGVESVTVTFTNGLTMIHEGESARQFAEGIKGMAETIGLFMQRAQAPQEVAEEPAPATRPLTLAELKRKKEES